MNNTPTQQQPSEQKPIHILTVGDGDLSYSLALLRCYDTLKDNKHHDNENSRRIFFTASTLLNPDEIIQTYKTAQTNTNEILQNYNSQVLYNVDATKLKSCLKNSQNKFKDQTYDIILFNHPHLGYEHLSNDAKHAQRHHALLSHYFDSAKDLLADNNKVRGLVQVSLCANQPRTWRVLQAARRCGYRLVHCSSTAQPPHHYLNICINNKNNTALKKILEANEVQNGWKAPRKYRSGKLGSSHFLGRYGYTHRRTAGDADMSVHHSLDLVFALIQSHDNYNYNDDRWKDLCESAEHQAKIHGLFDTLEESTCNDGLFDTLEESTCNVVSKSQWKHSCPICETDFDSLDALQRHLEAPALPDEMEVIWRCEKSGKEFASKYALEVYQNQQVKASECHGITNNTSSSNSSSNSKSTLQAMPTMLMPEVHVLSSNKRKHKRRIVLESASGKRLRWWARQPEGFGSIIRSRRQCNAVVARGAIQINGEIAYDTSRILKTGDELVILLDDQQGAAFTQARHQQTNKNVPLQIHYEDEHFVVVWKSAGMRTCGNFAGTLQMALSCKLALDTTAPPLTRLETGCSGLCVSAKSKSCIFNNDDDDRKCLQISYGFVALVHGSLPRECKFEDFVNLPLCSERFWRQSRVLPAATASVTVNESSSSSSPWHSELATAKIERLESVKLSNGTQLSTLKLICKGRRGRVGHSICKLLRDAGCPVVGDSFCRSERAALPRGCRTKMKNKLHLACVEVNAVFMEHLSQLLLPNECNTATATATATATEGFHVTCPTPERYLASSWSDRTCSAADADQCESSNL